MITFDKTYSNGHLEDFSFRVSLPFGFSHESTAMLYFAIGTLGLQVYQTLFG